MMKQPDRDVIPATSTEELESWHNLEEVHGSKKIRRSFKHRKRAMFVNRKKPHHKWPPSNNLFLEEDMIKEDETVVGYMHRRFSWQRVRILLLHYFGYFRK